MLPCLKFPGVFVIILTISQLANVYECGLTIKLLKGVYFRDRFTATEDEGLFCWRYVSSDTYRPG